MTPHDQRRIIKPESGLARLDWREIYRSRELAWVFIKRGIAVRYRQMALGILWSFLEPLGLLALTTLVFGLMIRVPTGPYPYPVFVFSGLIPWLCFSKATTGAANSLLENIGIVSKVYFPRVLLPLTAAVRELLDSAMLFAVLLLLAWLYGYGPSARIIFAPVLLLYVALPALGLGMAVGSISIKFRDFRPLLALLLQAGFYTTPIFYPPELVPPRFKAVYELNPMYWGVELSRWITLGKPLVISPSFYLSIALSLAVVAVAYVIFARYERIVVDAQ
jgi:lipopolysaccharide transport system permease protein